MPEFFTECIPNFKTRSFHESFNYGYSYLSEFLTKGYIHLSGMVEGGTSFGLGGSYALDIIETRVNERRDIPINEIKYFIFPSDKTIENYIEKMMG